MKSVITLSILSALLLVAPQVHATEGSQDQTQDQKVEVECTTSGSYGQNTTCKTKVEQKESQNQKFIVRGGKVLGVHTPVNTGVDFPIMLIASAAVVTLGAAGVKLAEKK